MYQDGTKAWMSAGNTSHSDSGILRVGYCKISNRASRHCAALIRSSGNATVVFIWRLRIIVVVEGFVDRVFCLFSSG